MIRSRNRARGFSGGGITPSPYGLRIVGQGGYMPVYAGYNSGKTRLERRGYIKLGGMPVQSIRFIYWNGYVNLGEANNANSITVEAGLERITGASQTVMFTFSGASTKTLAAGEYAITDPIYASAFGLSEFPANYEMRSRTGVILASAGQVVPYMENVQREPITGQSSCISDSATSQIQNTGAIVTPSGGSTSSVTDFGCMAPVAIVGEWSGLPDISVLTFGDSIMLCTGDVANNGTIGGGWGTRGLRSVSSRAVPFVNIAKGGTKANDYVSASSPFRKYMMGFATHFIDEIGVNDAAASRTAAQIIINKQTIWADFKALGVGAKRLIATHLGTETTSTDSWATLANQTERTGFTVGGTATQVNTALDLLVGTSIEEILPLDLDWCDSVTPTKWPVTGAANYATSDGIHPSATMHGLAGTRLTTAAASWTTT